MARVAEQISPLPDLPSPLPTVGTRRQTGENPATAGDRVTSPRAVAAGGGVHRCLLHGSKKGGLAVGPTKREDRSRVTIRVDCTQTSIDQVIKQLYKLINVLKVNELDSEDAIERELLLVKVTAAPDRRAELVSLAGVFGARVVDVGSAAMTFEIVEHPSKLVAFEELLRPYGIKETVRTGRVAIRRSSTDSHRRARMRVIA